MSESSLRGKNAVITGAAGGIGRSICEMFAKHGCNIWACIHTISAENTAYFNSLQSQYGIWIKPICFELINSNSITKGIKTILDERIPVDIIINNAGVLDTALLVETTIDKIRQVFEINYFSTLLIIQKLAKRMIRQKYGNIVNIASIAGLENQPGRLAYGGSKASMIYMTRTLANELKPFGIRVNAIAPGPVETGMIEYYDSNQLDALRMETCNQRLGVPNDIANAVLFLASDASSHIDGQVLRVDGGR